MALFNRCYSHLTQQRARRNHPLATEVASGRSPVDACMSLFDKTALIKAGPNEGEMTTNDGEARNLIRTMDTFHRTWFPVNDFLLSGNCAEFCQEQAKLFDSTEPALHVTRALLGASVPYSEVVTGEGSVEAIRDSGPLKNSDLPHPFLSAAAPGAAETKQISTELVKKGYLNGVRLVSLNSAKNNVTVFGKYDHIAPGPIQVHESFGGGILGTKTYLMLNFGRDWDERTDGGRVLPRRWAQSVFSDLLCRSLPVVRPSDAKFYVTTNVTSATPPFRQSAGCMSCHTGMDFMASVARNLSLVLVPGRAEEGASGQIQQWPVNLPQELGMVEADPQFSFRPPNGRLIFRNYEGKLTQKPVRGLKELGEAISQTDDFYVCAASRYFQYFTGVSVTLQDPGDPASQPLSEAETYYHNEVVKLGLDLKKHQSLRTLVERILSSPTYHAAGQRLF